MDRINTLYIYRYISLFYFLIAFSHSYINSLINKKNPDYLISGLVLSIGKKTVSKIDLLSL